MLEFILDDLIISKDSQGRRTAGTGGGKDHLLKEVCNRVFLDSNSTSTTILASTMTLGKLLNSLCLFFQMQKVGKINIYLISIVKITYVFHIKHLCTQHSVKRIYN